MEKVRLKDLKVGVKYYAPMVANVEITVCTIKEVDSSGRYYTYTYERWDGDIVKARASHYGGNYSPNDELTLFLTKDEAKDYLRSEFEAKLETI
jgi:hypothetical protein